MPRRIVNATALLRIPRLACGPTHDGQPLCFSFYDQLHSAFGAEATTWRFPTGTPATQAAVREVGTMMAALGGVADDPTCSAAYWVQALFLEQAKDMRSLRASVALRAAHWSVAKNDWSPIELPSPV